MHAAGTISLRTLGVVLEDQVSVQCVTDRTGGRFAMSPQEAPGHRYADNAALRLDRADVTHDLRDDRPMPFGSVGVFGNSFARRVISSSISSWPIRLFATVNSEDSRVNTPARVPQMIRSWLRQL